MAPRSHSILLVGPPGSASPPLKLETAQSRRPSPRDNLALVASSPLPALASFRRPVDFVDDAGLGTKLISWVAADVVEDFRELRRVRKLADLLVSSRGPTL